MTEPIYVYRHRTCRQPFAASTMPAWHGMTSPRSSDWRIRRPEGWRRPFPFSTEGAVCPDCGADILPRPSVIALVKVLP